MFAYFPLTVIVVQWVWQNCGAEKMKWLRTGVSVAVAMMVVAQVPEVMRLVPVRWMASIPGPWEELYGWREYGAELDQLSEGAVVYCTSYENAAEASSDRCTKCRAKASTASGHGGGAISHGPPSPVRAGKSIWSG